MPPAVHVAISNWQYGCCGNVPNPGTRLDGPLAAAPARSGEQFAVTEPFTWHPDLELLRFDGWSARWAPDYGDPTTQPIVIRLSWHDEDQPDPAVEGVVTATYEVQVADVVADNGMHMARVPPGTPAADVEEPLYLRVLVDREYLPQTP